VSNNPLRYTDPTGHVRIADEDLQKNKASMSCSKNPQYCKNGKPMTHSDLKAIRDKRRNDAKENNKIESLIKPWYSGITDFTIGILSNPNTSVTTSALQVVSGTVMVVGIGLLVIPGAEPVGAALAIGAFAVNRSAALIGSAATYYQYSHHLNGVNKVDVAVSLSTTIVGTVPDFSEGAALVSFAYDFVNTVVPNLIGE
jgi:hypothetical protein